MLATKRPVEYMWQEDDSAFSSLPDAPSKQLKHRPTASIRAPNPLNSARDGRDNEPCQPEADATYYSGRNTMIALGQATMTRAL
jgi:hypothetical protein